MATRGEAQFVAARVGFWGDPLVLGLARDLHVSAGEAGSFWLRWEEFVLSVGDARTGRVRGYNAEHLAVAVGWRGHARKLIEALKRAKVLRLERGGAFVHPYWGETKTGYYAVGRAVDARRKELARDHARGDHEGKPVEDCPKCSGGQGAERPDSVRGQGADSLRRSGDQVIKTVPGLPPIPPQGGAFARWAWLEEYAPTPQNRDVCTKYLEAMSEEEWALVQAAYGLLRKTEAPLGVKEKRVLAWPTDSFLRKQAWLRFKRRTAPKPHTGNGATNGAGGIKVERAGEVALVDPETHRREGARRFLFAKLADPGLSTEEKRKAVQKHRESFPGDEVPDPEEPPS